jgi:hypothetical protein
MDPTTAMRRALMRSPEAAAGLSFVIPGRAQHEPENPFDGGSRGAMDSGLAALSRVAPE